MILLILLLALLLIGTQGCKTLPSDVAAEIDGIILPASPERPELQEVTSIKTAALQIAILQNYAREWEVWGYDARRIIEGE